MPPLVTKGEVAAVASVNVDTYASAIDMAIAAADLIVVEDFATATISTERKKRIELYLAAHFTHISIGDGPLAANSLGEGTERYHDIYMSGLRATQFGQQAIAIDTTGKLAQYADRVENPEKKSALFTTVGKQPANYYNEGIDDEYDEGFGL